MAKRRIWLWLIVAMAIIAGGIGIYTNVPLRTALFRSVIKGNFYITSEADTLYAFGWYGVRKFLVAEDGSLELLAENDDFCKRRFVGHLIGRSGEQSGDYLYVATRSYLGGGNELKSDDYEKGSFIVMRKGDLSVVSEETSDIKLTTARKHGNLLVVSGLKGYDIYDISRPESPKRIYKYRHDKYTEFQGLDFFDADSRTYVAFARFGEGISIHDITHPSDAKLIKTISLRDTLEGGKVLPSGLHCFSVVACYPYLYATIAPISGTFGKENDTRGIMAVDLSNLDSLRITATIIPRELDYEKQIGDPSPSFLCVRGHHLFTNYGEKGLAMFDLSDPADPRFDGLIEGCTENDVIYPIYLDAEGRLFMGAYHWPDIYCLDLKEYD